MNGISAFSIVATNTAIKKILKKMVTGSSGEDLMVHFKAQEDRQEYLRYLISNISLAKHLRKVGDIIIMEILDLTSI